MYWRRVRCQHGQHKVHLSSVFSSCLKSAPHIRAGSVLPLTSPNRAGRLSCCCYVLIARRKGKLPKVWIQIGTVPADCVLLSTLIYDHPFHCFAWEQFFSSAFPRGLAACSHCCTCCCLPTSPGSKLNTPEVNKPSSVLTD